MVPVRHEMQSAAVVVPHSVLKSYTAGQNQNSYKTTISGLGIVVAGHGNVVKIRGC